MAGTPVIIQNSAAKLWMPFQEGTGNPAVRAIPSATMGSITTYNGSPTWADGQVGKCLTYSAAAATKQYMISNVTRGSGDLCGFAVIDYTAGADLSYLFTDRGAAANNFQTLLSHTTGVFTGTIYNSAGGNAQISTTTDLRGKKSFVGFSINATAKTISLYANREYITSSVLASNFNACTEVIQIFRIGSNVRHYNGNASHLYIGGHQLTEKQFSVIYQSMRGQGIL